MLPEGWSLFAVGWLGSSVPKLGQTPDACAEGLARAYDRGDRFTDGTAGWHDCEVCTTHEARYPDGQPGPIVVWRGQARKLYGHGHHLVQHGSSVFMCPVLILHYIIDHGYQPPVGFVTAVTEGRFLTPADLVWRETHPNES
jgi:hypothetical protein